MTTITEVVDYQQKTNLHTILERMKREGKIRSYTIFNDLTATLLPVGNFTTIKIDLKAKTIKTMGRF